MTQDFSRQDKEDGLPYIDIANARGDNITYYTPIHDVFSIREEYSRIGWVRNIEDVFRDNLDDIFVWQALTSKSLVI